VAGGAEILARSLLSPPPEVSARDSCAGVLASAANERLYQTAGHELLIRPALRCRLLLLATATGALVLVQCHPHFLCGVRPQQRSQGGRLAAVPPLYGSRVFDSVVIPATRSFERCQNVLGMCLACAPIAVARLLRIWLWHLGSRPA